jgi:membrane-associated phospholipid phosphatase
LASLILLTYGEKIKVWVVVGLAYAIGMVVEMLGKEFLYHPSPPHLFYRGFGLFFPSGYVHTNYSYPSGHVFRTTFIVIVLILVWFLTRKFNKWWLGLAVAFLITMMISRVYLGEHWLSDVVGGGLLGVGFGLLTVPVLSIKR